MLQGGGGEHKATENLRGRQVPCGAKGHSLGTHIELGELHAATPVVAHDEISETHGASWSNGEVKTKADPKTNSAAQPSAGQ